MAQKEEKKKTKRPTALKRDIRNSKRREINRQFKSRARTAVRRFEDCLSSGDATKIEECLRHVHSLMDKGVKRGIFKKNTASRSKSRLTARARAATA